MNLLFDRTDKDIFQQIQHLLEPAEGEGLVIDLPYGSHAEGVIEIAACLELRVAWALKILLNSREKDEQHQRLKALERLYHDVYSAHKGLRLNAARVLVEIMKEVFVSQDDRQRQLELIRDFREVFTGKPGIVRKHLAFYQLLEIPEDSSQLSFDDNVDNASCLGSKSACHLVLDAWIKGIRKFQVVVRNYISAHFAYELHSAAEILGVEVEIGVELPLYYHNKFIKVVWTPLGLNNPSAFSRFLRSETVLGFFKASKTVGGYHQQLVLSLLDEFDEKVRGWLEHEYGVSFKPLSKKRYQDFLGKIYPTEVNLSEFIYTSIEEQAQGDTARELIPELILIKYIKPLSMEMSLEPEEACKHGCMVSTIRELVKLLNSMALSYRLTLLTSNLHSWEIPELIYQSKGGVKAVEIFNLRDYTLASEGLIKYGDGRINRFRKAVNERDITTIKLLLTEDIGEVNEREITGKEEILAGLQRVRKNIGKLLDHYAAVHIEAAIGSGAAGRGQVFYGMGLVVQQSLSRSGLRSLKRKDNATHLDLPLGCQVYKRLEYLTVGKGGFSGLWSRFQAFSQRRRTWVRQTIKEVVGAAYESRIVTLSGRFGEKLRHEYEHCRGYCWEYLNSDIKNIVKILIGFIPAFLTFYLTSEWPVLKYGGGLIWFAITGGRNVLQAILSSGGFDHRLNLSWRSLVNKKRISESLMYTGLSVPLLEYVVRVVFLKHMLGIDAGTSPMAVYSMMSAVNGVYIALHNYIRGFPTAAIVGNLFRSVLAVPVSLLLSSVFQEGLILLQVVNVDNIISQWSAVISKAASDTIACLIEGLADRSAYLALRSREVSEIKVKFLRLCERIELMLPSRSLSEVLGDPVQLQDAADSAKSSTVEELVLLYLDLMYFWYNKPRARSSISLGLKEVGAEEKLLFKEALGLLTDEDLVARSLQRFGGAKGIEQVMGYYRENKERFAQGFNKALAH